MLRHQRLTLAVTLATMAATIFLYVKIPKGFFPQQDTGRLTGSIVADQDTSFQAQRRRLDSQFVDTVHARPGGRERRPAFVGGGTLNTGAHVRRL